MANQASNTGGNTAVSVGQPTIEYIKQINNKLTDIDATTLRNLLLHGAYSKSELDYVINNYLALPQKYSAKFTTQFLKDAFNRNANAYITKDEIKKINKEISL
jgi:hypothetical protein